MKVARSIKFMGVSTVVSLTLACGAQSKSTTEDTSSTDTSTTSTSTTATNKVGSVSNIADLKLSGALAINLPEAFGGSANGTNLRLLAGLKSQEACMMGSTIKQSVQSLGEVAGFFCHLEVEKDRMKFGKKYKLNTSQGEFAKIFVDNSQAASGKLTISFCQADMGKGGHRQLITIDTLTEAGPKGAIISDGSGTENGVAMTYARSTSFDMSVKDIVNLISKDKNTMSGNTFVREVGLDLKKSGQSSLKLANKGSNGTAEFFDRGIAYMGSDRGSAVFQSKGADGSNSWDFSRRAHFSKSGEVLTSTDVGADLQPATTAMPAYLAADFAPDAPTGWVGNNCPDFDEEVTIDPTSGGHAACEQDHSNGDMDCWDQTKYQSSSEQITVQ